MQPPFQQSAASAHIDVRSALDPRLRTHKPQHA
jgi:hypothetical protein